MTSSAVRFAPGKSLSGPFGPERLSLISFELVLHMSMTPTLAVIPKTIIRYHSGHDASSATIFELTLSDNNDITLSVNGNSVAIERDIARRYFYRFIMLEAWSFRDKKMLNIGLRLENEVERAIAIPTFEPSIIGYVTMGGEGAEFSLKDKLLLARPLTLSERLDCLHYFQQRRKDE